VSEEETRGLIQRLFREQKVGVLSTDMDGQPYASLVGFLASEDLRNLFFATERTTRKYTALTANPRVAMLIDSRPGRTEDFEHAVAVTVIGRASEVDRQEHRDTVEAYRARHPALRGFIESPSSALIRVSAEVYYVVARFQDVTVLRVGP
jgi:nitroimidazol reductase NimA-like FMN-containing flavoprotein (pyridoxamine 5'-phosphate oxidase superfamily)